MGLLYLKLPESEDYAVYFPDSIRYFRINEETKSILEDMDNGTEFSVLHDRYNLSENEYNSLCELFSEKTGCSDLENTGYISRLTINLTNCCNLKCRYCYAHGGSYECKSDFMTKETAKQVIDRFAEKFNNIYMIQFFGGEPLLNPDVFEFLCEYIIEQSKNGILNPGIGERPRLVLMTNFSVVDDRILDIIKKYSVNVTVSIDGPETINSLTRPMKNGHSHSEAVKENIERLRQMTNGRQPQLIEATYTKLHMEQGISPVDVIRYFKNEFGVERVHLLPAMVPEESDCRISDYSVLTEAAAEIIDEMKKGNNYRFDKIDDNFVRLKLRSKPRRFICDAGQSQYSVSTDGDIYPCYALAGDKSLIMGNVYEDVFHSDRYITQRKRYAEKDRLLSEPCKSCFGRMLCHGCMAIYKSLGNEMFTPAETVCNTFLDILKMTIVYLAEQEKQCADLTHGCMETKNEQ